MEYQKKAKELMDYIFIAERNKQSFFNMISEMSKGEVAVLFYLMNEKDGAYANDISHFFEINTSRVAAILNSLCKKGFVKREPDMQDKRKIHVYLTKQGKEYGHQRKEMLVMHVSEILRSLGEEDTKEYIRIVKKISEFKYFEKG